VIYFTVTPENSSGPATIYIAGCADLSDKGIKIPEKDLYKYNVL